ncbi:MAG: hypothetical protein RBQ95_07585 [Paracholeplasma sp.]|nr:hypothetical protein [Paracholeplasma sp.]MDY3196707.1 hypothetical protein [Paracholeplasma sp.]
MLTNYGKEVYLKGVREGLSIVSLINDFDNYQLGDLIDKTLVQQMSRVSYPDSINLVWQDATTRTETTNQAGNSNPLTFSVKRGEAPTKYIIYNDDGQYYNIRGIITLPTPVPDYTNGGAIYLEKIEISF